MELSNKTARQLYAEIKEKPTRARFGFGRKPALVNVDLQKAYTAVGEFVTAYETDPKQLAYINQVAELARAKRLPVVWTYVAYTDSGEDCGVWGTRSNTPDSLQNIKVGSRRSQFDDRLVIDPHYDIIINKRMASASMRPTLPPCSRSIAVTPSSSRAVPRRAVCAPRLSTASRTATAPWFPRNAWPTSTRARISPISMIWP